MSYDQIDGTAVVNKPGFGEQQERRRRRASDNGGLGNGFLAGALVATEQGWQKVEDLRTGDRIVTFDHGLRPIKAIRISKLFNAPGTTPRDFWPLSLPAGTMGNRTEVQVLPAQVLLIESDAAEDMFGAPFLMVSAGVLTGFKGIERVEPAREMTIVSLEFERDEIVYSNGTLMVRCHAGRRATDAERAQSSYPCLTETQGLELVEAMHARA